MNCEDVHDMPSSSSNADCEDADGIAYQDELGPVYLHRWLDVQDEYNKWYEAQIAAIAPDHPNHIKVHYKGWKSKFDCWIDLEAEPERVRLLHTFTERPPSLGALPSYEVGSKCDCLDSTDKWYQAEIIKRAQDGKLLRMHYQGWDAKYDEWINADSYRIAPLHSKTSASSHTSSSTTGSATTHTSALSSATSRNKHNDSNIASPASQTLIHAASPSKSKKGKGQKIVRKPKFKRNTNDNSVSSAASSVPATSTRTPEHRQDHNIAVPTPIAEENSSVHETVNVNVTEPDQAIASNNHEDVNNTSANSSPNNEQVQISSEQFLRNFKPSLQDEAQFAAKLAANKGMEIIAMGEDGNCLFRSISHQVYGQEDYHEILRAKCVKYLQSEFEYFGSYVPGGGERHVFDAYCQRMARNGVWGDNLEIQAFSEIYGRSIEIYAYNDKPMKTFSNESTASTAPSSSSNINDEAREKRPTIRLSYHCNSHYNSIIKRSSHGQHLLDATKVGLVEDEKIRLSYLRSVHANQSTVQISDIEATDLAYFQQALKESRKTFEENNNGVNGSQGNLQLDEAIQKSLQSLAEFEQDTMEQAKQISLKEQEDKELQRAIAQSMQAQTMPDANGNYHMHGGNDTLLVAGPTTDGGDDAQLNQAIKAVIDRGYSLDQATLAWTIFEPQKDQFDAQTLIEKMIDYIQLQSFSYSQNFDD
eukprot:CAMPEP_0202708978 /NCGR_PEP_ID=MMETSP1385-20130828/21116_1 /ASSEMBLY_ACC=CAM_ASM_000861 /TAXON_ID=933848 /ORGANISM="Elphidium margaritaceum" /LENGTH=701 /DNA_ID=CAMNT_0049368111 /DNA_START=144 /DNA_END=2249 /DNA_ORIENTATION=-